MKRLVNETKEINSRRKDSNSFKKIKGGNFIADNF